MRIACTSDLHGYLPPVPACDLLLIAGDVCPLEDHSLEAQRWWLKEKFAPWLEQARVQAREIVWIAGNHDLLLDSRARNDLALPRVLAEAATYLCDSSVTVGGLKIFGSPWSGWIGPWAFSLFEAGERPPLHFQRTPELPPAPGHWPRTMEEAYERIPEDTDILLCHGPPKGACDLTRRGVSAGSSALRRRIEEVSPRLVVCGHIHEAHGRARIGETAVIGASLLDESYERAYPVELLELDVGADARSGSRPGGGAMTKCRSAESEAKRVRCLARVASGHDEHRP